MASDVDIESDLTPLPSSRSASPCIEDSDDGWRAAVAAAIVDVRGRNSKATKRLRRRKRLREDDVGVESAKTKRVRGEKILQAHIGGVEYVVDSAPVTSTGFTALRDAGERGLAEREELRDFDYVGWQGRCVPSDLAPPMG